MTTLTLLEDELHLLYFTYKINVHSYKSVKVKEHKSTSRNYDNDVTFISYGSWYAEADWLPVLREGSLGSDL